MISMLNCSIKSSLVNWYYIYVLITNWASLKCYRHNWDGDWPVGLYAVPCAPMHTHTQVVWMTYSAAFVGLLPAGWFKRWLNARIYKISFRMLARSLSLVLTIHNREYMPNGAGVCVANHTTPIDVVLLSTENVFSMVLQPYCMHTTC